MKYIRTKNGIVLNPAPLDCGNNEFGTYMGEDARQADTIEKLCDCYSYDTETTRDVAVARSWKLHNKEREIFGCIKTDKGLIYVAKMNEEGVLCLI